MNPFKALLCFRPQIAILAVLIVHTGFSANVDVTIIENHAFPPDVAVNVGDTVTWHAGGPSDVQSVESYTGEFISPVMVERGSSFSYTFTRPGLYPYHHIGHEPTPPYTPVSSRIAKQGTVTVLAWSNQPPAVTINTPIEGSHWGWSLWGPTTPSISEWITLRASVTNQPAEIARLEFHAGANLLAAVTNAPYQFTWTNAPLGTHVLTARSVDLQGVIRESRPVTIQAVDTTTASRFLNPRIVAGGLLVTEYVINPTYGNQILHRMPTVDQFGIERKQTKRSATFITEMTNQFEFFRIQARF
jgi:hypothetical protein